MARCQFACSPCCRLGECVFGSSELLDSDACCKRGCVVGTEAVHDTIGIGFREGWFRLDFREPTVVRSCLSFNV